MADSPVSKEDKCEEINPNKSPETQNDSKSKS